MKSYFTTACGVGTVVFTTLSQLFPSKQTMFLALAGLCTGLIGVFAKDWNVTGGNKKEEI